MSDAEDPSLTHRVAAAEALLFRVVERVDPATGERTSARVPSPLYAQYRERKAAYEAARASYAVAREDALRTPAGRATWPMTGAALQLQVKQAHDRLRTLQPEVIEQAEALLARVPGGAREA